MATRLAPSFSVNAPAQAAAVWSLENGEGVLSRRRAAAARERDRLAKALHASPLSVAPSETSLVWLASDRHDGRTLAEHLAARRITVAPGHQWGDERHVRVTLRDAAATDRLVGALAELPG
jgi:histidinol-phosphate/aromatic aminotransferase/cobyric acid decarboxylase-like protein